MVAWPCGIDVCAHDHRGLVNRDEGQQREQKASDPQRYPLRTAGRPSAVDAQIQFGSQSISFGSSLCTFEPRFPFAWESMPRHAVGYGRALATFSLGFSPVRELVLVMRGIRNPARGGQATRSDILW